MSEDEIELKLTDDGSHTLYSPRFRQYYHSYFGAWKECLHIFIQEGWEKLDVNISTVNVFEMGMGTGMNTLLTLQKTNNGSRIVNYFVTEAYPLPEKIVQSLNHKDVLKDADLKRAYDVIHSCDWEKEIALSEKFTFRKTQVLMQDLILPLNYFHLIYYHAFAPNLQPELWTLEIFEKLLSSLQPGGVLTTYCSKGEVRRKMQTAGFEVERLPGPPGKREMLRARKPKD